MKSGEIQWNRKKQKTGKKKERIWQNEQTFVHRGHFGVSQSSVDLVQHYVLGKSYVKLKLKRSFSKYVPLQKFLLGMDHSCSGVREKTKPYSLVLGSYQWGKKYFSVYVQKLPKKAKFIAIRYFNFWVQHWQLPSLDTYGFVWPDWFLACCYPFIKLACNLKGSFVHLMNFKCQQTLEEKLRAAKECQIDLRQTNWKSWS